MPIIDLYRSGYDRGYQEAVSGMRRLPKWELLLRSPTSLLPGVNTDTYIKGYADGYTLGLTKEHWQDANKSNRNENNNGVVAMAVVVLPIRQLLRISPFGIIAFGVIALGATKSTGMAAISYYIDGNDMNTARNEFKKFTPSLTGINTK